MIKVELSLEEMDGIINALVSRPYIEVFQIVARLIEAKNEATTEMTPMPEHEIRAVETKVN